MGNLCSPKWGYQELIEANVTAPSGHMALRLNTTTQFADILYRFPPYRQRHSPQMQRAANKPPLNGILTRILRSTSGSELITMCVLALRYKAQHYKQEGCLLKHVMAQARAKASERSERNAEEAQSKACILLEK